MSARSFVGFGALILLLTSVAYGGGAFQRTKDGKTLVWNNSPERGDAATWSGERDSDGYATGQGTLTWYRVDLKMSVGSNLPSQRQNIFIGRYSGNMVHGKFEGSVVNVDSSGKTFHGTYVKGKKTNNWTTGSSSTDERHEKQMSAAKAEDVPAEGPKPSPSARPRQVVVASPPPTATPAQTSTLLAMAALDSAVRNRVIADFKRQTQTVLSRVGEATGNFHEIEGLDSVPKWPAQVTDSVSSLIDRARDVRSELGDESAVEECRPEIETINALSVADQVTQDMAGNDASLASTKLNGFLQSNPEPPADDQKPLWHYLISLQLSFSRAETEAQAHLELGKSLAEANKTSEAIREYQKAYQIFPNPATAEKIRQLQDNSLGL